MTADIDLPAYFARIGFAGEARADLVTLAALHRLHPQAIAFENLNPLLRQPVPLDTAALQAKMVQGRRGGWCFEQNSLFRHALSAIGFDVQGWIARVLWGQPDDKITARTHKVLRVRIAGQDYLADVGFGGNVMTAPLRLISGEEQSTPNGLYRLLDLDGGYKLQGRVADEWKTMYRFAPEPQQDIDYVAASHYVETHPTSIFLSNLLAARVTAERRHGLLNAAYTCRDRDNQLIETRTLASGAEIRDTLERIFLLDVPAAADAALARLIDA